MDGYKHDDVVNYQQNVFLPARFAKEPHLQVWTDENIADPVQSDSLIGNDIFWYHDKSVNYAHDHWQHYWVPYHETAVPWLKGKGHSLIVADFVSANYS